MWTICDNCRRLSPHLYTVVSICGNACMFLVFASFVLRYPFTCHHVYNHDDVIKWKHFARYWPFVRAIHRAPVNSPHKWPVTRSFDVYFDLRPNKRLSKQSRGWWFETLLCPLWRHRNDKWHLRRQWNVDQSDVVGASPVGAAPTTSSFST